MLRLAIAAALLTWLAPRPAEACGGYIARTDAIMLNEAIELVVVRDGTRTEISVRNRYRGPVEEFALLVPVPTVLHEDDVHTLDPDVFAKLEAMTAPRIEYLDEDDPCGPDMGMASGSGGGPGEGSGTGAQVWVEDRFEVAEYDIEVLSATDAAALDRWLHAHDYVVPAAMAPLLRPYVESNAKFFVAKVDPARVRFVGGVATLSPLRFGYDADEVSLPLRLSTANSPGAQDVLVHTISTHVLEAANRPNVRIPTDLSINAVGDVGDFYEALFADTLAKNPGAVVTEFTGKRFVDAAVLAELGLHQAQPDAVAITRLHLRLDRNGPHDDLVLRVSDEDDEHSASYKVIAWWHGPATCAEPKWGRLSSELAPGGGAGTGSPGGIGVGPVPEHEPALAPFLSKGPPHRGAGSGSGSGSSERTATGGGGCCDAGGGAPGSTVVLVLLVLLALPSRRGPLRPGVRDARAVRV